MTSYRRSWRPHSSFFFLMIRRPPRSTLDRSSAASDVYKRQSLGEAAHESRRDALAATFSLRNIAIEGISGLVPLLPFYQRREDQEISRDVHEWLDLLVTEVDRSRRNASEQLAQLDELISQSQQLEGGMGLRFLYDEERRIFAIGYQVAELSLIHIS